MTNLLTFVGITLIMFSLTIVVQRYDWIAYFMSLTICIGTVLLSIGLTKQGDRK